MNTPIADFVRGYEKQNMTRFHMPGHKGQAFLGCEALDITEVTGADSLYEADGIIAESEANATALFGTGRTLYGTEGSSQCVRAMLYLAIQGKQDGKRPCVVAARNVHKAFVYAAAVLDIDVIWLEQDADKNSLCSCMVTPQGLEQKLQAMGKAPAAVYVTSPDYLGNQLDIRGLAEVCHNHGTILAVDNAHGAYLHFLHPSQHPMDLGADICCDSAHKTLPVLTGGAYLHIGKNAPEHFKASAKHAMALFGSTSPSYLILASLDLCNDYLVDAYKDALANVIIETEVLREVLRRVGWKVENTEPLKLTVHMPKQLDGRDVAKRLRQEQIECEYADAEYVVCMVTPENTKGDFDRLLDVFGENQTPYTEEQCLPISNIVQKLTIREAIFATQETVPVSTAVGRICGSPTVSCPPAIPIVVSGEMIDETAVRLFQHYGIEYVEVVKE